MSDEHLGPSPLAAFYPVWLTKESAERAADYASTLAALSGPFSQELTRIAARLTEALARSLLPKLAAANFGPLWAVPKLGPDEARDPALKGVLLSLAKKPWQEAPRMALHDRLHELGRGDLALAFREHCLVAGLVPMRSGYRPQLHGDRALELQPLTRESWADAARAMTRTEVRQLLAAWRVHLRHHLGVDPEPSAEIPF